MLDRRLRKLVDRPLASIAAHCPLSANKITLSGALLVPPITLLLATQHWLFALTLILANRLLDGLDGAVARRRGPSAWGGYLDSLCDYLFYVGVPIGFGLGAHENLLPALLLVSSFILTAVSFLALAAIAAKADLGYGDKAFAYTPGLIEGGETIAAFAAMCLLPGRFALLASICAALCLLTVAHRLWQAHRLFN